MDTMTDKEAIEILSRLMEKETITVEEKEAIRTALGILAWTSLIPNRMEHRKKRRDKERMDDEA